MLFNSISFAIFLPIVFFLYWFVANRSFKTQNILLLLSSYIFYSFWDYRFLALLVFSTLLDYYTGIKISASKNVASRRFWLFLSIFINLGFLGFFKYFNFFIESFTSLLSQFGIKSNPWSLQIILPIGISFYTFHGLSYVIDIYKEKVKVEKKIIDYAVFVSFFPLLVAGPIERATHLLPQIQKSRQFDYSKAVEGSRQILWGLVKKIVIADQCSEYVNEIFAHYDAYSGSSLFLGAVLFSLQIYGDFSGYSDIAIGTSHLFGIELLQNFKYPYFSRSISEFWRRWHVSLSSWFKDYLYIPLGGSKVSAGRKISNVFIIFLVSGFWHGANWTFIVWGALHAFYILPSIILNKNRNYLNVVAEDTILPNRQEIFSILSTFCLVVLAWVFFRAENVQHAFFYLKHLFSSSFFDWPDIVIKKKFLLVVFIFFVAEWFGRRHTFALEQLQERVATRLFRWLIYYMLVFCVLYFSGSEQPFIYFQF